MTSKALIEDFIAQKSLAIVGVSRAGNKFGNGIYRELKTKGYSLFILHPKAAQLEGVPAYKDFSSLPEKVGGVIVNIKPQQAETIVRAASAAGITRIWLQQGSSSQAAIDFCNQNGVSLVHDECILMYAVGTSIHGFHRWLWKLFGKAPK
jgi:predicted CoA-binding protein